MPKTDILAVQKYRDNGALIAAVAALYLNPSDRILDPTFQNGVWWREWKPDPDAGGELVTQAYDECGIDFRSQPHDDGAFDVVAYDPTYVCTGGKDTSTIPTFNKAYGMDGRIPDWPKTPEGLLAMNVDGLRECSRVTRAGGLVLCKYQHQVWSGKLFRGAAKMIDAGEEMGLVVEDEYVHVGDYRPQPQRDRKCPTCQGAMKIRPQLVDVEAHVALTGGGDSELIECVTCAGTGRVESGQQHARQNVSYLIVFRTPVRKASSNTLF